MGGTSARRSRRSGCPRPVTWRAPPRGALEGVRRKVGTTGAELLEAKGAVELAEAALERAAIEEAKIHERVLRHNATEGERELAAAWGQLMAGVDNVNRKTRTLNNGNAAAMAFIRAKGHLLPEGYAAIGNGGEYVRVGEASYCGRAEVFQLGFIPFCPPGAPIGHGG